MKKQLTVALGLAVLATPAFATKARLQGLGEDSYGSYYINDNRNIWLNAAQINNHKDLVTYEFGSTVAQDSAATPRGEGGVYKAMGNMVYGVHFGGASNTSNGLRTASGVANGQENNNVDVFVGGDAGLKWGANLGYSKQTDDNRSTGASSESMRTRLGVIMGDTQVFANINLANRAKDTNATGNKFEGKLGYQVGAIQAWDGNSLFADYRSFTGDSITGLGKKDISLQQLLVGIGRVERLNDKSNLFLRANLQWAKAENDISVLPANGCTLATGLGCREYKTTRIPVVVGLETEATSWLTLRGSVGQVLWGTEEGKKDERTIANSTIINAGATLKFGELSVDGVIGNGDSSGAATPNAGTAGNGTPAGTLRTDVLMSRVAMTYRF